MDGRWLDSLEERAAAVLPAPVLEYVLQGSRDGVTAAEASAAWSRVRFLPRVLRDVTDVDLTCDLLGRPAAIPWGVAPSTLQRAIHPDGELAMARATRDAGSVMVVSSCWHLVRRAGRHGGPLVAPGLPSGGPRAGCRAPRTGGGCRRGGGGVDPRHPGRRQQVRRR